jgi:threonine dehydrogenase-like Zn-dependent dehydrogenase
MSDTMFAAVLHEPGDMRIERVPVPDVGCDEVKIAVTLNGLCGTDVTEYTKGPMMVPLHTPHPNSGHVGPTVLGHEFIGTVVETGANATHLMGLRVACGAGVACGACDQCAAGRTNLCRKYYTLGLSVNGGLAEFVVAPADICIPIPDGLSDEDAVLAQPLAVGIHTVRRAHVQPGQSIALIGLGAIGAFICAALRGHDGDVIAMDVDPARLALARELGATSTHLLSMDETPHSIRAAFPQGIDVVFETAGVTGAAERAYALAVEGGTVVLVGLNKTPQPLVLSAIVLREVNTVTTVAHVCADDMPDALELLTKRPLAHLLVDTTVPLSDVVDGAFGRLATGQATGKIIVDARGIGEGASASSAAEEHSLTT